jgi:transcription elongation factor
MIQRCNALWMSQTPEEAASAVAAAAAAVPSQQSPFRNSRRSPSPYSCKTPSGDKSGRRRSPTPGAAKGGRNNSLCFYHSRFGNKAHKCEKGCSYQEN